MRGSLILKCFMFIVLLIWPAASFGEIYSWIDDFGVVHYSDFVPEKGKKVKVSREIKESSGNYEDANFQGLDAGKQKSSQFLYSRSKLSKNLKLKTREQVFRFLGKPPDLKESDSLWIYKGVSRNPDSGKPENLILRFGYHRGKNRSVEIAFSVPNN